MEWSSSLSISIHRPPRPPPPRHSGSICWFHIDILRNPLIMGGQLRLTLLVAVAIGTASAQPGQLNPLLQDNYTSPVSNVQLLPPPSPLMQASSREKLTYKPVDQYHLFQCYRLCQSGGRRRRRLQSNLATLVSLSMG